MSRLMRFPASVRRDPAIDAWMRDHRRPLGTIAQRWFEVMRRCGDDVRELLHDGHPTACVGDAAFGYVNAFTAHVNVGFFLGATMADPAGLLEGTGRFMRHVKLRPDREVDAAALTALIEAAYTDMRARVRHSAMKPKTITSWTTVLAALLLPGALSAHHAARLFETTTPIRVTGTIVRYIWANPHSAIIVDQNTEDGETIRWALESSVPIRGLESRGFSSDSFKPGDVIEACGFAPRTAASAPTDASTRSRTNPGPAWLGGADRVITARLLLTQNGPEVHWSHYGPLELCISEEELAARSR